MEGIREQLVKRPATFVDSVKKIGIICLSFLLAAILIIFARAFASGLYFVLELAVLVAIGIVAGGIYLSTRLNVEYEYAIIDGELTIDKIYNKRSRKNICSLTLRSADAFYRSEHVTDGSSVIEACGEGDRYTIEYSDQARGKTQLVITPDERTLEVLKIYLPRAI